MPPVFTPGQRRSYGRQRVPTAPRAPNTGGRTPYRLGRDFERAIRGRLERRGYFVMRAYGSKGKIDLLAVTKATVVVDLPDNVLGDPERVEVPLTRTLGIQCKRRGDIGSTEWNALFDLCAEYGIMPVVAVKASERTVAFYRLDERRIPRKPGRPWTEVDPATGEPLPEQLTLP